jgi:hypothetical protein
VGIQRHSEGDHPGGSQVGGATGRSGDLDAVGRYRGTRDSGEKGDGRYRDTPPLECYKHNPADAAYLCETDVSKCV